LATGAECLLHALEALVGRLTAVRRFGDATAAAGAAVRADPLRESAQAALIRVHLAEGNQSEALRAFDRFSHLLQADLGLVPTPQLRELVADLLESPALG
jgi:SARP family transcriptional regulator, regulator of embCAB operon